MPFKIIEDDITNLDVDVIVNAANKELQQGGGVCGAIFNAAGASELQAACDEIGGCPVGEAVMTDGFQLPAKKIIHTVGPIWQGGHANEATQLKKCYQNALTLAHTNDFQSIAFPLISSGIYGYPIEEAFRMAVSTIREFLQEHEMVVYLVIFDKKILRVDEHLITSISKYLDEHLEEEQVYLQNEMEDIVLEESIESSLESVLERLDESFSERLLRLIDEKGMTDVKTYKKANIDRRLFSKIRNSDTYNPQKKTVIAFAIALELTMEETLDLLAKAGYTLSRSSKFDVIIEYFIAEQNYDIHEINEALFNFDQILLGA